MKSLSFILFFTIASYSVCSAQNQVVDTHPTAIIYAIDPQTGQEAMAQSDDAILFKDAFIDLVSNTIVAKMAIAPGHKSLVITQMDPSGGNAYQLVLETKIFGQTTTVYTFSYNVDQNTLYYYDKNVQSWLPETIQGRNVVNLNNCLAYGKFNEQAPAAPPVPASMDQAANNDQQTADGSDQTVYTDNAPPVLQTDDQPECPADGYLWQPGYWAYSPAGYYWVNGTWVAPPQEGLLWTPPYWGFEGGRYLFHAGYWGAEVGYYGGIYYGYGYGGHGYYGGNWSGGHFRYNTAVLRVNVNTVHNTYVDRTVIRENPHARVSFNGPGGVNAKPTPREIQASNGKHINDFSQNPKAVRNDQRPGGHNNIQNNPNGNNPRTQGNNNNTPRTNNFAPRTTTGNAPGASGNNNVPKTTNGTFGSRGNTPGAQGNNAPKVPGNGPPVPGNAFGSRNTNGNAPGSNVKGKQPVQTNKTKSTGSTKTTDQKNNDKKQQ
jgi:hypothetical protein